MHYLTTLSAFCLPIIFLSMSKGNTLCSSSIATDVLVSSLFCFFNNSNTWSWFTIPKIEKTTYQNTKITYNPTNQDTLTLSNILYTYSHTCVCYMQCIKFHNQHIFPLIFYHDHLHCFKNPPGTQSQRGYIVIY